VCRTSQSVSSCRVQGSRSRDYDILECDAVLSGLRGVQSQELFLPSFVRTVGREEAVGMVAIALNEVTWRVESEAVIPPLFSAVASHAHTHTHCPPLSGSRAPGPPPPRPPSCRSSRAVHYRVCFSCGVGFTVGTSLVMVRCAGDLKLGVVVCGLRQDHW
jgi:hypothetical protein